MPFRRPDTESNKKVSRLVERILTAKAKYADADVSQLEREIDELVYALYDLTPEEIIIVDGSKWTLRPHAGNRGPRGKVAL